MCDGRAGHEQNVQMNGGLYNDITDTKKTSTHMLLTGESFEINICNPKLPQCNLKSGLNDDLVHSKNGV